MRIQVKKHKDGSVEILEAGKSTDVLLTHEQAKSLAELLIAATRG